MKKKGMICSSVPKVNSLHSQVREGWTMDEGRFVQMGLIKHGGRPRGEVLVSPLEDILKSRLKLEV